LLAQTTEREVPRSIPILKISLTIAGTVCRAGAAGLAAAGDVALAGAAGFADGAGLAFATVDFAVPAAAGVFPAGVFAAGVLPAAGFFAAAGLAAGVFAGAVLRGAFLAETAASLAAVVLRVAAALGVGAGSCSAAGDAVFDPFVVVFLFGSAGLPAVVFFAAIMMLLKIFQLLFSHK
jgi:hypothetical protein